VSVAATYAEALFESAVAAGTVPEVADQLAQFRDAIAANPELHDVLENPEFDTQVKKDVVADLLTGANALVANFAQVLLDREFSDRVAAAEGRLRVRVRTAIALPDDLRERLIAQISERTGRPVDIDAVIDHEIVGGLVIETDGSVVDASVRARLASIRHNMLQTPVLSAVDAESV
jgi:F-type H+-transporting ATPase subunit delta